MSNQIINDSHTYTPNRKNVHQIPKYWACYLTSKLFYFFTYNFKVHNIILETKNVHEGTFKSAHFYSPRWPIIVYRILLTKSHHSITHTLNHMGNTHIYLLRMVFVISQMIYLICGSSNSEMVLYLLLICQMP